MVHILPHWTWPGLEGKTIPVMAYSNCEKVELLLNETSLGIREMDDTLMYARWDVPYQPDTLKVVAYKGDAVAATMQHVTASTPQGCA